MRLKKKRKKKRMTPYSILVILSVYKCGILFIMDIFALVLIFKIVINVIYLRKKKKEKELLRKFLILAEENGQTVLV